MDEKVCILDFDWADREDEARYPPELCMTNNWHADVQPGGLIHKEHYDYQVNRSLDGQ